MKPGLKLSGLVLALVITTSCGITLPSQRKAVEAYAAKLTYVTVPASVLGTAEDVKVHYEEAGDTGAPVIILIHGFSSSTVTWKDCIPELSKQYHVFALDMPGWGFSDKPKDFPYRPAGYAKTVLYFMDKKGIDKATLCGNSMGGEISLWVTITAPDKVSRLILVDSGGYPLKTPSALKILNVPGVRPLSKPFLGKGYLRMGLKQVYYDDSKVTPELVELYDRPYRTAHAKDVPFWIFQREKSLNELGSQKISGIKVPTLIIWGENDPWIPIEDANRFHKDISGSTLVVIPKCGHVPEEEKPAEVVKAILDFMGK